MNETGLLYHHDNKGKIHKHGKLLKEHFTHFNPFIESGSYM